MGNRAEVPNCWTHTTSIRGDLSSKHIQNLKGFWGVSIQGFPVGKYCKLKKRFPIVGHIPLPGFNGHSNGMLKSILGDGIRAFVFPPYSRFESFGVLLRVLRFLILFLRLKTKTNILLPRPL